MGAPYPSPTEWLDPGRELLGAIRGRVRAALARSRASGAVQGLARPVAQGVGDVSFAIDVGAEAEVSAWHERFARRAPLSLLSEESGWRHLGPDPAGAPRELAGFDHGGSALVIDPIDGTRNLMADLRSAWTALAIVGPGALEPRSGAVEAALLGELPPAGAGTWREFSARRGAGCRLVERALEAPAGAPPLRALELAADADARVDHGYFSFFRYTPALRPALARIEAEFFARLERHEGAALAHCYEDQYISNAGQLALLALGTYRFVADLRAWLGARLAIPCTSAKPYDVAAAILVAREAGCVVEGPLGEALDVPLDARTPVSFVGYANAATAARLRPHLAAVLHEVAARA